jgi:hypothetical protein
MTHEIIVIAVNTGESGESRVFNGKRNFWWNRERGFRCPQRRKVEKG